MKENLWKHLPQDLVNKSQVEYINYLSISQFSFHLLLSISHIGSSRLTFLVITHVQCLGGEANLKNLGLGGQRTELEYHQD